MASSDGTRLLALLLLIAPAASFVPQGINVLKEGVVTGEEIDAGGFIDQHYYASGLRPAPLPRRAVVYCCEQESKSPAAAIGKAAGFAYLGNIIFTVTLGILSRAGLVSLPPVNTLTDIANNAMDAELAAGTIQPLFATAYGIYFWLGLLRDYNAAGDQAAFVGAYCAAHASLCTDVVF